MAMLRRGAMILWGSGLVLSWLSPGARVLAAPQAAAADAGSAGAKTAPAPSAMAPANKVPPSPPANPSTPVQPARPAPKTPLHGGKGRVFDCIRAVTEGYKCSFTKEAAALPKLNAQLRGLNKGSCVVNGARPFGSSDTADFIEVSCADGGPGWVIEYPKASESPSSVLNCAQAASFGTGGCKLPTNVKK